VGASFPRLDVLRLWTLHGLGGDETDDPTENRMIVFDLLAPGRILRNLGVNLQPMTLRPPFVLPDGRIASGA
ncbi:MAG TPA: hypothetical protein VFV02_17490, partial [Acidimicrobiales bacterium]|nr:hypothetical protein [Acidimicrobiales bacterium]